MVLEVSQVFHLTLFSLLVDISTFTCVSVIIFTALLCLTEILDCIGASSPKDRINSLALFNLS